MLTRFQTKGYTLEQLGGIFGDEVVDDQGHRMDQPSSEKEKDAKTSIAEEV